MTQCFVQGHATTRKRTSNYVGCCLLDEKFRLRLVEQVASQNRLRYRIIMSKWHPHGL
jgi:hypothetical protein